VSGDVANEDVEMFLTWIDETIISADRPYWLIVGLHSHVSPSKTLGCKALLHTLGEMKLFLHLPLAC
jgi:hypothetical protein